MDRKINIPFADDKPGLLKIGQTFLEHTGDSLITTTPEAAEAIHPPQTRYMYVYEVIISHYQMWKMDEIAFPKHLKVEGDTTHFIIITGRGREESVGMPGRGDVSGPDS